MAKRSSRIYWRERGGVKRAYGDFRDFADVGGGQEALKPSGALTATSDPDIARQLVADRVKELELRRRNRALLGVDREATLGGYAQYHLEQKATSNRFADRWLCTVERHLTEALAFFGNRNLATINTQDVQRYVAHLRKMPARKSGGGFIEEGTVRAYLNSLSNLYRRAQSEGYVIPGYNPVAALMEKPVARRKEAKWLEVSDAALLLEAARLYQPPRGKPAYPHMHPLLATFLLTGGRKSEVLGLMVDDVSFDRRTVTFRPNQYRTLKSRSSHRTVPLFPQLETILREYVFGGNAPRMGLLFASAHADGDAMLDNVDRSIAAVARLAGFPDGYIHLHMLRHSFCAARLQTLDRGHPVSEFTVAKEMGHGGDALVKRLYGHLGNIRHRSEAVEYHVEQHARELSSRLPDVRARAKVSCS